MLSAYRYRSVLNIFHEVYLFCYRVFYYGTPKVKDSSLIVTEKKVLNKIFLVSDWQKEQHTTVRLVLSSPSWTNFQCDIGTSIYHLK